MFKRLFWLSFVIVFISCNQENSHSIKVSTNEELKEAIFNAVPGDNIVLSKGVWKDVEIVFEGNGTHKKPIKISAEENGKVFIEGKSNIKIGGSFLEVEGLFFRNGYTTSNAVIDFKIDKENVANNCKVTNCVIIDFNQLSRDKKDHWVEFWGKNNELSNCYLAGKTNVGPTIRIEIKGNRNIRNHHKIINNHFGPRPRKGGPKGETIQLGDSFSSMSPSNTLVANNLFDRCNGEVEVISSKTNYNEFRNNVFYKSEGSLVTRHGNYCIIDGNYFIGDKNNSNIGGIRLINTGHRVTNNYFINLKGKEFRSPLAVMNGIPKSPLNRYNQVTDVVVAYNTYINCTSPWQFGVGQNLSQKDVLPVSEIRSARPLRTVVANNVIYNSVGDVNPIIEHDKADGVTFKSNVINNQGVKFNNPKALIPIDFELNQISEFIYAPKGLDSVEIYNGFDVKNIATDILNNNRFEKNSVGAMVKSSFDDPLILDESKYGPNWFVQPAEVTQGKIIKASPEKDLQNLIAEAERGDIIELESGIYQISASLKVNKSITIKSNAKEVIISYNGEEDSPLFELQPYGKLTLENVTLQGNGKQYAFASLKENMHNHFGLKTTHVKVEEFKYVLKVYKQTFAEEITFVNSQFINCENGIELSEEINDKGDYNVEFLTFNHCNFENIQKNVIDYYRGGYDESTIGGNLLVKNSKFKNCGAKEENGILINSRGIVNVNLINNEFVNNKVKLIALLWGAKNNSQSNNTITNSGIIKTEQNLKLKLMY